MDVVICLASKDYHIVKKNVRYVREYLQQESDSVYIISNRINKFFFPDRWLRKYHSVFIDEDNMLEGLSFQHVYQTLKSHFKCTIYAGWYLQQFLKMGFALSPYAKEEYLIWDSDTLPLHPMSFVENCKYLLTGNTEHHKPYFETLHRLLGFGKLCEVSFIAEHMPIRVEVMRELIDAIGHSDVNGDYWFDKIIYATSGIDEQAFSEFETYGNYCVKYHSDLFELRGLRTLREAGMLFCRGVKKGDLDILARMNFDTASFEIRHVPPFPHNIYYWWDRVLLAFYRRIGIIKK